MTRPAISATGLRKSFGDHVVLDGIDVADATVIATRVAAVPAAARTPRALRPGTAGQATSGLSAR